jgi:hypothetical protein
MDPENYLKSLKPMLSKIFEVTPKETNLDWDLDGADALEVTIQGGIFMFYCWKDCVYFRFYTELDSTNNGVPVYEALDEDEKVCRFISSADSYDLEKLRYQFSAYELALFISEIQISLVAIRQGSVVTRKVPTDIVSKFRNRAYVEALSLVPQLDAAQKGLEAEQYREKHPGQQFLKYFLMVAGFGSLLAIFAPK